MKGGTHCKRGHEYTPENTALSSNSRGRKCRQCERETRRATRKRNRNTKRVRNDGIIDEIALERVFAGDRAVYDRLSLEELYELRRRAVGYPRISAVEASLGLTKGAISNPSSRYAAA